MITTLLFDAFGNTLLENSLGRFLPAYFDLLGKVFARLAPPENVGAALVAGTQAMMQNTDPRRTLREVFEAVFYQSLPLDPASAQAQADEFYAEHFPTLRALTGQRPAARRIMEWAAARELRLAICSQPMYPRTAIEQRLAWAGVPDSEFHYALLRGYETARFTKPHPEFFAEILAALGCQAEEVLVVGDDWNDEILPAASLGMRGYWVTSDGGSETGRSAIVLGASVTNLGPGGIADHRLVGRGTLDDLERWLKNGGLDSLPASEAQLAGPVLPAVLAGNLAAILTAVAGESLLDWTARPIAGEWSLTEIVCHLRDGEIEVHGPRYRLMTREINPFISGVDSDVWAAGRDYQAQDGRAALSAFAEERCRNVEFLAALAPDDFARPVRHAIIGPSTLADIVRLSIDHDRLHLRQMAHTIDAARPAPASL